MSESTSFGSSNSSNQSFIPDFQQSPVLMQIAQMAAQLGQQQYNWAQGEYAKTSQVTGDAVNNYLDASNLSKNLAQNNLDRYEGLFQPMENQLVDDANTYSSDARVRSEMGAAESGVGQSFDAGRQNMERQLQSFGIDPSSGRYAELERANDAARSAAQAGAGQAARFNTENTGRQLRQQAIQVGQQYPGQIANTLNAQANDLAGMENATLGNANTGTNMFRGANDFMGTAMRLGYPPLGTKGGSASSQNSNSSRPNSGSGSGSRPGSGAGSGSGAGGSSGSPGYDPNVSAYQAHPSFYSGGAGITNLDPSAGGGDYSGDPTGGWGADSSDQGLGTTANNGYGYNGQDFGADPWAGNDATAGWGGADPYAGASSPFGDTSSYYDSSAFGPDPNAGGGDGYTDTGGYDFAAGGAIPDDGTTGGFVDQSLSPSQGRQTDDIPANLNANEFVIPRDVALWKGQEFFQKLIDQSRQARQGAPAKGKPAPAPQGQPRFVSGAAR